ncbi:MAG: ribonuclease P protein component [Planctomycetes bacterium]|nr:ribonuclease P protein component [Planctomycetota bacterium]
MRRFFFRNRQRIRSNAEFTAILRHKCCARDNLCVLYVQVNSLGYPRFGVGVSKKLGPAVVRNRLKRFGREAFRLGQHDIAEEYDYLLIYVAKKPKNSKATVWRDVEFEQVRRSFEKLSDEAAGKWRLQER